MNLDEYSQKRDFKKTPEPKGEKDLSDQHRFVVQRHRATRLHYDFRLEMDGVLKSWAVPKGPSLYPPTKRLAIHTEDHPVKYLSFEGTIPKGNYGAGEMTIWDSGTYKSAPNQKLSLVEQWKKGNLKIILNGKKLKGEFALVKTRSGENQNQWLLIKKKDQYSTEKDYDAEDFAETYTNPSVRKLENLDAEHFIEPMLASPKKEIFNHPDWIFEMKWDGYRMLSSIKKGEVNCYSRNGISFTKKFSKIADSLASIPFDAILDGEVVAIDEKGKPNFQALQNYPENNWEDLRYYVFDILYLNGHSTLELALTDRKSLIPEVIEGCENVFYCEEVEGMGVAFYNKAIDGGMEGVVAKKMDSTYTPGYRSKNWLKIKTIETEEALICGYTESESDHLFGSLILGNYQDDELIYIGNCGSGFSQEDKKEYFHKFQSFRRKTSPFDQKIDLKGRIPNWMSPKLIAEVKFSEWTKEGKMRHPVFKALRKDKNPKEVKKQIPVEEVEKMTSSSEDSALEINGVVVPFSNLEKVYWPESGLRKYDLIDYYIRVSDIILPYLKDRPQNLHRHPNGISSEGFYQKDMDETVLKPWMETVEVFSKSNEKELNYLLCQNEATLLYMANLGCIEINPWNSRKNTLNKPDYAIIDLDPSEKNTFEEVIETAQATKEVLDELGIQGFCKTSGSTGIHIFLPLQAKYSYEEARDFTKLICYQILQKLPKLTTLERIKSKRGNRIYLDYLQNRKGQTIAAPYCVRPKPGATVSAPLEWNEVKKGLQIRDFHIQNVAERIKKKGDLFKPVLEKGIDMEKVLENF